MKKSEFLRNIKKDIKNKVFTLPDYFKFLENFSKNFIKFEESVDIEFHFNTARLTKDFFLKDYCFLPHGSGQKKCIAVYYKNFNEKFDLKLADILISDEFFFSNFSRKDLKKRLKCSYLITTPTFVKDLNKFSSILNSIGLYPTIKNGLIVDDNDFLSHINNCKFFRIDYKIDSFGILRSSVGRASFTPSQLENNILFLLTDVFKKIFFNYSSDFLKNVYISTTMGPSFCISSKLFKFV